LSKPAKERNAIERVDFLLQISQYTANQLVFVDESAYDKRSLSQRFGWSIIGKWAKKSTFLYVVVGLQLKEHFVLMDS